jgi:glycosyltransferase involved in cell wall biosynthesis
MNDQNLAAPLGCEQPVRVAIIGGDRAGTDATLAQLLARGLVGHELTVLTGADEFGPDHDVVHLWTFGLAAISALRRARDLALAVTAAFDVEALDAPAEPVAAALYRSCDIVLSPTPAADRALTEIGLAPWRIRRFQPGVDLEMYSPARYCPDVLDPGAAPDTARINLLVPGPLPDAAAARLLTEAFLLARDRDSRLHLVLAGAGNEPRRLGARLGNAVTHLGPLDPDRLAQVYASTDLLVVPAFGDGSAEAILAAQASGLPVLAGDSRGARELIENGRSGCLVTPGPFELAEAIRGLTRRPALLDRLATGGLHAVRGRTWERALGQLAGAWSAALTGDARPGADAEVARAA